MLKLYMSGKNLRSRKNLRSSTTIHLGDTSAAMRARVGKDRHACAVYSRVPN